MALPDRLTQVYIKQPDHPTFFAKGMDDHDTTANGVFFGEHGTHHDENENGQFCAPPAGWSAERHEDQEFEEAEVPRNVPDMAKRYFTDDSNLEFIPRENFYTAREGFVYRLGSQGLGYYKDRGPWETLRIIS